MPGQPLSNYTEPRYGDDARLVWEDVVEPDMPLWQVIILRGGKYATERDVAGDGGGGCHQLRISCLCPG